MTASAATKKRCWSFHVTGVNRKKGSKIKEASVLSSFRERYTAVRRLALSSSTTTTTTASTAGVNGAKGSPAGVGSSKTVCIEVQFIGPQPSQGPGALLCNLLSGTSVEARPIELRRGRDNNNVNKRKRTDSNTSSGSDEGSDPEAEDGRVGKSVRPDVLRPQTELHAKVPSLLTRDISPGRHPPPAQDIRSHRDDITTYIKVSDELEQVPAPRTQPVYLTPLSLKALASFPAHPSTPLNEIPPSTPPSQVPPSSPPSDDVPAPLPLLTARTDAALPPFAPRDAAPLPYSMATRTDVLPLSTPRRDAPLPFLTPRNSVVGLPESNSRNGVVLSPLSTLSKAAAALTPPRGGALLPPSTLRNNDSGASPPTSSNDNAGVASSSLDTRMHWEDVIGRINVPPPSRGVLGRQHSLDIGDIASSSDGDGDGEGDFDDATEREMFSSTGSSGKESEYDEEDAAAATAATTQGRITSHHIDGNAGGIGCTNTPFYDPALTFDMADELLDPPSGSVHQRGLPSSESARSFSCAREILRGASFQCSDHIGLDNSHGTYGAVADVDPHKDSFAQHSRNSSTSSGLDSTAVLSGCGADGSAEGVHRVSLPSTPALVSCGATGQPNVVVGLVREFQECDFDGHHLPSLSTAPAFSGGHYQVVIDGLETVGHAPQDLVTTAHFSVDSNYKVGRRASPIRVGANGKSHAALFYPSMQDVWPEVYITSNVRTVEVDVTVDIRSRDGTFHHTTPNLKVIYRRAPFYCTEE